MSVVNPARFVTSRTEVSLLLSIPLQSRRLLDTHTLKFDRSPLPRRQRASGSRPHARCFVDERPCHMALARSSYAIIHRIAASKTRLATSRRLFQLLRSSGGAGAKHAANEPNLHRSCTCSESSPASTAPQVIHAAAAAVVPCSRYKSWPGVHRARLAYLPGHAQT